MWRKVFRRERGDPPPPAAPVDYTRTLEALARTDDPEERVVLSRLLGAQVQQAMGRLADNTQVAVWAVEEQWRDMLREQLGVTNEMVSSVLSATDRQAAALGALREAVQSLTETIGQHDTRLEQADRALEILNAALVVSLDQRQSLTAQVGSLATTLARLEAALMRGDG